MQERKKAFTGKADEREKGGEKYIIQFTRGVKLSA